MQTKLLKGSMGMPIKSFVLNLLLISIFYPKKKYANRTKTGILHQMQAAITLYIAHQDGKLTMELKDDGIGFEPDDSKFTIHHGLLAIRERVYDLNGEFTIDSAPGKGTCLIVSIPV